jgi:sigma-E factor negative regulatory protein RseC
MKTVLVLLGYLSPALAMLLGAGIAAAINGGDSALALGAIAGFLVALSIARMAIPLLPERRPAPQLIPLSNQSRTFRQE